MAKPPKQRRSGQTGGFGGMGSNRARSLQRGGRPSKGGGGTGRKPPGGCVTIPLLALAATILTYTADKI